MLDEEEYASDTSDEDYVPVGEGEAVSEDEVSGEEENLDNLNDDPECASKGKGKRKKPVKKKVIEATRKRKGGIKLEDDPATVENTEPDTYNRELQESMQKELEAKKQEDEKKKADDLWAMFKSDTTPSRPKPAGGSGLGILTSTIKSPAVNKPAIKPTCEASKPSPVASPAISAASKITITKEYDFAGETVKVTKELDINSKEAQKELKKKTEDETKPSPAAASPAGVKRPGGLGNVLGLIGKKQKISTLEKSKLDWESFKEQEGISDELAIHNRGKEGYIERKAFLERTDMRQFEIEKSVRLSNSKR